MRRPLAAVALLAALVVAGCGGGTTTNVTTVIQGPPAQQAPAKVAAKANVPAATKAQVSVGCPPPAGEGALGACVAKPVQVHGTKVTPLTFDPPASIPDVSSWQGVVNWPAVKSWQVGHHYTPAGIFKMGEYVLDPYAARNNSELRRLGMWRAGYWFVRNTGCAHEAGQITTEARYLGLKVVVLDDEVPEARGYDGCLTPKIKAAGFIVAEYASPGAYPGGARSSNPAWIAAYGPSTPPAAPWGGPIKAFQCTDGVFGCVTYVPGIGRGDVSIDYGITKLGQKPPRPPDPYRFLDKTKRHFAGGVTASEYNTVKTYERRKCVQPARRPVCKSSTNHLDKLIGRLWYVAHNYHDSHGWHKRRRADWSNGRGGRFRRMWNDRHRSHL